MKSKTSEAQESLHVSTVDAWLRNMSDEQVAAIMHDDGPCRLVALAGSGKTRVVVHRILRLVQERGVDPRRILALTFSKKAADEMAARARKLGNDGVRVGTWHSVALQILKVDGHECTGHGWEVGPEQRAILKGILGFKKMNWRDADANRVLDFISKCKSHLHAPGDPGAAERARAMFARQASLALEAFHHYNEECFSKRILTFDDYLVRVAEHLEDEENRARWAAKWDHLIQDEAQDENPAQKHLVRMLAGEHRNYMAVGDALQAIYGFRESTPDSLVNFESEWPGAKTYWLTGNYRSGRRILAAANEVVSRARILNYEPRPLRAQLDVEGTVAVRPHEDLDDEARSFAEHVRAGVEAGDSKYSAFCALFRVNAQSRALEEALIGERIPYVVVGGQSFYERKEVRQLLAYLRVASGSGEVDDVEACINAPFRFLGKAFVERLKDAAEDLIDEEDSSVVDWAGLVRSVGQQERIQYRQKESADGWASLIGRVGERCRSRNREESAPAGILDDIVRETGFLAWLTKEEGAETVEVSQAGNVKELVRVASRFETVAKFLGYIDDTIREARAQREDRQAGGNRVLLMNVHRSKGLEFDRVWLSGFNENIFPHPMGDPEEERRLAYVAITRAKSELVVSHVRTMATKAGIRDAEPSRFVGEIGKSLGTQEVQ